MILVPRFSIPGHAQNNGARAGIWAFFSFQPKSDTLCEMTSPGIFGVCNPRNTGSVRKRDSALFVVSL